MSRSINLLSQRFSSRPAISPAVIARKQALKNQHPQYPLIPFNELSKAIPLLRNGVILHRSDTRPPEEIIKEKAFTPKNNSEIYLNGHHARGVVCFSLYAEASVRMMLKNQAKFLYSLYLSPESQVELLYMGGSLKTIASVAAAFDAEASLMVRKREEQVTSETLFTQTQILTDNHPKVFHELFAQKSIGIGEDITLGDENTIAEFNFPEQNTKLEKALKKFNLNYQNRSESARGL